MVIIILALLSVRIYIYSPKLQSLVALYTEEDFSDDNVYSDLESLSRRLDEEILKGSESFTVYLKDLDIDAINKNIQFISDNKEKLKVLSKVSESLL